MRQDPGSGCQLCQEALGQCQMGREVLRPWAEPEAGSQHRGQRQGLPIGWAPGTTAGCKEFRMLHPACLGSA